MKRRISKKIQPILEELKISFEEIYGKNLKGIILYGSYARGTADQDSDIDLILLLKRVKSPVVEIERCSQKIGEIELKYDTLISLVPVGEKEFRRRKLPLFLNAIKEGVPIYAG